MVNNDDSNDISGQKDMQRQDNRSSEAGIQIVIVLQLNIDASIFYSVR